jgi:hypothetical protein
MYWRESVSGFSSLVSRERSHCAEFAIIRETRNEKRETRNGAALPRKLTEGGGVVIVHLIYGPRQTLNGTDGKDRQPLQAEGFYFSDQ